MTTSNIADQPHVICFVSGERLVPCSAAYGLGIDRTHAIYSTRDEADEHLGLWTSGVAIEYFSVPASVLFDVKTTRVFRLR